MSIYLSILLGVGLAMDACAVSIANGLKEPKMPLKKLFFMALMFGLFQALMPMIGYFVGHAVLTIIEKYIPWIALFLLLYVGGSMVYHGIKPNEEEDNNKITIKKIFIQAVATSIDALSVGFTLAEYSVSDTMVTVLIIFLVTSIICIAAVFLGKRFGLKLGHKAEILGGIILIGIGIQIFISGII